MYNTSAENVSFFTSESDLPEESVVRMARLLLLLPRLIFLLLVFLFGIVGNLGVLFIYHFKWRASTFSLFVKVLAVLDLLNCFTSVPAAIALVIGQDHVNTNKLCSITPFLSLYTSIASGFLFIIIAIQRYLGICKPLMVSFELPLAKKLCILCVLIAIVPSALRLFLEDGLTYDVKFNNITFNITMCVVTQESKDTVIYKGYLAILALLFLAIFGTLIILYILMWRTMLQHADQRSELFQNQAINCNTKKNSQKDNSFKIFFAVTVVFLMSYLPHLIIVTLKDREAGLAPVGRAFYDLAYYSPLWNNVANPFIYSFFSADFRYQCKNILRSSCCKEDSYNTGNTRLASMHQRSCRTIQSVC